MIGFARPSEVKPNAAVASEPGSGLMVRLLCPSTACDFWLASSEFSGEAISAVFQLRFVYVSVVVRMCFTYVSVVFQLFFSFVSAVFQLCFGCVSVVCQSNFCKYMP